ncbi:hypothetical protein FKP32DRAFT_562336 [Trametes sanguinea]|nr:hypothetical protein FKP32DRAFT_562336 [Trametes sanguinea]
MHCTHTTLHWEHSRSPEIATIQASKLSPGVSTSASAQLLQGPSQARGRRDHDSGGSRYRDSAYSRSRCRGSRSL